VCSRGVEVQWQREPREGHASCVCPYVGVGVVNWIRGHPGVHAVQRGRQRTLPMGLHVRGGSATQGSRRHAFGRVGSANGAGGMRLRRRAPGMGIPAGAATGGSRAAGSVDATLHDMRRRCDGSRRQVDRWALRWCKHSTCGRLDDGNSAGDVTRAWSRGWDWGKTTLTGWLACGDGLRHCRSRPVQRKTAREAFPFLEFLFHLNFQADEIERNT
jgi:hypothetical protein